MVTADGKDICLFSVLPWTVRPASSGEHRATCKVHQTSFSGCRYTDPWAILADESMTIWNEWKQNMNPWWHLCCWAPLTLSADTQSQAACSYQAGWSDGHVRQPGGLPIVVGISRVGIGHPDFFLGGRLPTLPPCAGAHAWKSFVLS